MLWVPYEILCGRAAVQLGITKWWRLAYLDLDIQLNQSYDSLICFYFRDLSLAAWKIMKGKMIHLNLYRCSWLWGHEEHIFGFSGNGSGETELVVGIYLVNILVGKLCLFIICWLVRIIRFFCLPYHVHQMVGPQFVRICNCHSDRLQG